MEQNVIISFIAELFKRLFAKSPAFFKVIQVIAAIVAIITGLPALLDAAHVVLPPVLAKFESTLVAIASLVGLFVAALTVERTALVPGNQVVKAQVEGKVFLPFTARMEKKTIEETANEPVVVEKPTPAPRKPAPRKKK